VRCFNSDTGVEVWKADYDAAAGEKDQVQYGVGSRATPTIDGGLVYTYGCLGHIACWQLADGKQVWLKKATDMGGQRPMWGFASSPLVLDDKVIVQPGGQGQLLALDKKTGEKVWASPAGPAGYSTPALVTIAGKQQLIATSGAAIAAFDPKCGGKLWEAPWATAFGMNCTTPMMVGGKLLISSSNVDKKHGGEGLFEVGEGGLKAVWTTLAFGAAHNDPVVIAGMLYAYSGYSMDDKGTLVCADMTTGQIKWSSKEVAGPGTVLQVGKQILCLGNRGKLTLIDPSPEGFKKVTEFQAIDGYPVWTVPVITHNKLYVRWTEHLICYAIAQ